MSHNQHIFFNFGERPVTKIELDKMNNDVNLVISNTKHNDNLWEEREWKRSRPEEHSNGYKINNIIKREYQSKFQCQQPFYLNERHALAKKLEQVVTCNIRKLPEQAKKSSDGKANRM